MHETYQEPRQSKTPEEKSRGQESSPPQAKLPPSSKDIVVTDIESFRLKYPPMTNEQIKAELRAAFKEAGVSRWAQQARAKRLAREAQARAAEEPQAEPAK